MIHSGKAKACTRGAEPRKIMSPNPTTAGRIIFAFMTDLNVVMKMYLPAESAGSAYWTVIMISGPANAQAEGGDKPGCKLVKLGTWENVL